MPGDVRQKMRQETGHPPAKSAANSDRGDKGRLASHAFALARSAEAVARTLQDREKRQQTAGNPALDENLKLVAEHNLRRFLGCLYVDTDKAPRQMYWNLLVQEQRWFAVGLERVEVLDRLFRDCSSRVERQISQIDAERAGGLDVTRNEMLLNNMLQTRAMLRDLLQNEMRCN